MTKENAKEFLPLVQALAEGRTIQFRANDGHWADIESPDFGCQPDCYRIKPEPRRLWVVYSGSTLVCALRSQIDARETATDYTDAAVVSFLEEVVQP